MKRIRLFGAALGVLLGLGASTASAEPHFALAKQYARCTTCHYSATGGGLLTAYGRSLSRQEVSTWGRSAPGTEPATEGRREEDPFYGALGKMIGAFDLGLDLRPAHLEYDLAGIKSDRDLWMRADLEAAVRQGSWTFYGDFGHKEGRRGEETHWTSWEYWGAWQSEGGAGFRAGRFLPAYGIHNADHTSYTRRDLGFDKDSQVLGVEFSQTADKHLYQFSFSPGTAESWLNDVRKSERRFTATGRLQFDLGTKNVLVLSGMYRDNTEFDPASWYGGVAHGWAPHPRVALWGELDERVSEGWDGTPEYTLFYEASVEVYRGMWLKFAPQLQTAINDVSAGKVRYAVTAQLFPRPHWNLNFTWTHDRDRESGFVVKTWLAQLHLYL